MSDAGGFSIFDGKDFIHVTPAQWVAMTRLASAIVDTDALPPVDEGDAAAIRAFFSEPD